MLAEYGVCLGPSAELSYKVVGIELAEAQTICYWSWADCLQDFF